MSEPIITLDLHGLRQDEAQKMIDNVLSKIDNGTYQIKRIISGENQGTTILVIREL